MRPCMELNCVIQKLWSPEYNNVDGNYHLLASPSHRELGEDSSKEDKIIIALCKVMLLKLNLQGGHTK